MASRSSSPLSPSPSPLSPSPSPLSSPFSSPRPAKTASQKAGTVKIKTFKKYWFADQFDVRSVDEDGFINFLVCNVCTRQLDAVRHAAAGAKGATKKGGAAMRYIEGVTAAHQGNMGKHVTSAWHKAARAAGVDLFFLEFPGYSIALTSPSSSRIACQAPTFPNLRVYCLPPVLVVNYYPVDECIMLCLYDNFCFNNRRCFLGIRGVAIRFVLSCSAQGCLFVRNNYNTNRRPPSPPVSSER